MQPFLTLWTNIRGTTRDVIDNRSLGYALIYISIGGIGSIMSGLLDSELNEFIPIPLIFILCVVLGPVLMIIGQFVYAGLAVLFGRMFKGTGSFNDVFKALGLGYIPYVFLIPIYTIWMFVDPEGLFYADATPNIALLIISIILTIGAVIYGIIVNIVALSEAHQYSKWRAFVTLAIPGLILLLIFVVIVVAFLALFVAFL